MDVILLILFFFTMSLLAILGIVLYFLPAVIAYRRNHANRGAILLINFLLGWTFLGWAGSLIWAFIDTDGSKTDSMFRNVGGNKYEDLERLYRLKESGALTDVEFEIEKAKLLK